MDSSGNNTAEIRIYPNPNRGEFEVSLLAGKSSELTIRVFNLAGKIIFEDRKSGYSGIYNKRIDLKAHAAGIYLLSLSINDTAFTQKILYTNH